jgi:hypothetical protein
MVFRNILLSYHYQFSNCLHYPFLCEIKHYFVLSITLEWVDFNIVSSSENGSNKNVK